MKKWKKIIEILGNNIKNNKNMKLKYKKIIKKYKKSNINNKNYFDKLK